MEKKLEIGEFPQPEEKFNPFIHGTNSSIFAVLAKSDFQVMSPIEMMSRYQAAPMTGELTLGGYQNTESNGNTSFALLSPAPIFNNAYTLEKVITYTEIPMTTYSDCLQRFKEALERSPKIAFSNINLLLIYFTQARQMGYSLEKIISPEELLLFKENVEASYQFFHFISLLGKYIHPDFNAVSIAGNKAFDEVYKYLTYENIIKRIKESHLNIEEISANPTKENLEKVLMVLKLPEDSELGGQQFFCLEANYPPPRGRKIEYDSEEDEEPTDYALYCLSMNQSSQKIETLLEDFLRNRKRQPFFQMLGGKAVTPIVGLKERMALFEQLVEAPAEKFLFSPEQKTFLSNQFPIVLICESRMKVHLIAKSTQEYRSNQPLKLGDDIQIVATDTNEHRTIILDYLRANQINNVEVILFEDLKKCRETGQRPIVASTTNETRLPKEVPLDNNLEINVQPTQYAKKKNNVDSTLKLDDPELLSQDNKLDSLKEKDEHTIKTRYVSWKPPYQENGLPDCPPKWSKAVFEWTKFNNLSGNYDDNHLLAVCERISDDIIERPYHYDAHELYDTEGNSLSYEHQFPRKDMPPAKVDGGVVYKRNHGTGHALRQMVYTDALIDLVALNGNKEGRDIAQKVKNNTQIKSAIKLAAYCKRIGRTIDHEEDKNRPRNVPTIYSKRSADIFNQIATELGYDSDLIKIISTSMLEPMPIGIELKTNETIGIDADALKNFSERLLMSAHRADLARSKTVSRESIERTLKSYFNPTSVKQVATDLVELACKANEMTGNRVFLQESGVKYNLKLFLDSEKLLQPTINLKNTWQKLNKLAAKSLRLHYIYAAGSRNHFFEANTSEFKKLKPELKSLKGDKLKTAILNDFANSLSDVNKDEDLIKKVNDFRKTDEYKILAQAQGIWTCALQSLSSEVKTSSIKALESIIRDKKVQLLEEKNIISVYT